MPKMIAVDELHAMLQSVQKGLTMLHEDPRFAHMATGIAAEITATNEIRKMVERMDAVDAEPVRHGRWEQMVWTDTGNNAGYKCSVCGLVARRKHRYCHCGAMMDAKEEDHATD